MNLSKRTQYFGSKNQPVEVNDLLQKEPLTKRILIVDDDPDITYTFKEGIEYGSSSSIKVYTYNDPLVALSEFKPNYYDLILLDINLSVLNGFELYEKILELDINVKACSVA